MQDAHSDNEKRKARFGITRVATIVIVAIIAAAAVGTVTAVEYGMHGGGRGPAYTTLTFTSTVGSSVSSSAQSSVQSSAESSIQSSVQSSIHESESSTGTGIGVLSILITDPPHLPNGVTGLLIAYPSMYVHQAGLPDGAGWIQVSSSGSIQLLGAVDFGQTVASANIPAGVYNMIRFNVSSAVVTYNSQNYNAMVQNGNLTVHFVGSLTVDPFQPSALILDVQPFVYNFGTASNPNFVVKPSAFSFSVPSNAVIPQMQHFGNMFQFQASDTWFWRFRSAYYPNVNIVSATLSNSSLVAIVSNPSNQSVTIKAITITSMQGTSGGFGQGAGYMMNASTPNSLSGSAAFLIQSDGTLTQLSRTQYSGEPLNLSTLIWGSEGYTLTKGASITFSHSGLIQLSLRMPMNIQPGAIVSGQQYLISLIGDGVCANFVVTAS